MALNIHFISGLPRSGSTLLAAILRQNPRFSASMSSPLADIFSNVLHSMSLSESSLFLTNEQRERVLRAIVEAYYSHLAPGGVIFDTNRVWCAALPALVRLFPDAKVVCCVRNPAWILDSIERLVQSNALQVSKMFGPEVNSVTARVAAMKVGFLGNPLNALRQAWYGEHASRLIAVRYESLTQQPAEVISSLYEAVGEPPFAHEFDHLAYDEPEFDARLNMPGLHRVGARVEAKDRTTILPPDLFNENDRCFWDMPGQNPRAVRIL